MPKANPDPKPNPDESLWNFLAECSLRDFLTDPAQKDETRPGVLLPALCELGIPPEWAEKIEATVVEFARDAQVRCLPGDQPFASRLRVFCRKNIPAPAGQREWTHLESGKDIHGGWGYFLIERGGPGFSESPEHTGNSIDLYLYREGEFP